MHPFQIIANADKAISRFPGWSKADDEDDYSHFQAPLSINDMTEAGLFLEGGTYAHIPDQNVCFEVVLLTHGGAKRHKLMRVDWRSLKGGHTNQRRFDCPGECPKRTGDTHFHSFDINWRKAEQKLRSPRLPCAVDIEDNLQSFEELRSFVGKHFRIKNIDLVLPPEWEYTFQYGNAAARSG